MPPMKRKGIKSLSPFGQGGVSHAIKRPSKAKLSAEKAKRDKVAKAAALKLIRERRRMSASAVASAPATPAALRTLQQQTARAGSLTGSVDYVLKNGQYQFSRRRSPRKHADMYSSPLLTRKTPAKLFTPSGSGDYLRPSPGNSPVGGKRRLQMPSPVKFEKQGKDLDGDGGVGGMEKNVSGILASLEEEEEKIDKENEYKVVVEEDELNKMAWEAAQEIEELRYEDSDEEEAAGQGGKENAAAADNAHTGDTVEEAMEKMFGEGEKDEDDKENGGVFPIFRRSSARTGLRGSPAKLASTPSRAKKSQSSSADPTQMVIDAGQKQIAGESAMCKSCLFLYAKGDTHEERLHEAAHRKYLGIVGFAGWKNERLALEDDAGDWKVLRVKPGDPKRHWEKANAVREVVDAALGIASGPLRQPSGSEAYLMVAEKRVVGFLLAEPLKATDKLEKSFLRGGARVLASPGKVRREALVGICRIWVHPEFQRRGFASKMVDAMRAMYRIPMAVSKDEIAFSHTTEMGSKFAESYVGKKELYMYMPEA